jgi:hypothetical protein
MNDFIPWLLMFGSGAGIAVIVWSTVVAAGRADRAMDRMFEQETLAPSDLLDPPIRKSATSNHQSTISISLLSLNPQLIR